MSKAKTHICTSTTTDVIVRGTSLMELIDELSFTEMIYFQMLGRRATPAQTAVVDACLVALIVHGLTPSAIATRLVYGSAPEAMQGAVAAGLLGVGGRFVGTVEGCAALVARIAAAADRAAECDAIVRDGPRLPGFGHDVHAPDDPRTPRLFEVARAHGLAGAHVDALILLGHRLDAAKGRHLTINATGAVAAVLLDAGVPPEILRGVALIARCAGLVGHLHEEQHEPAMAELWHAGERAVPYE